MIDLARLKRIVRATERREARRAQRTGEHCLQAAALSVRALLVAALVAIGGCATVPKDYPRTASTAFQAHESTTVGREVAALAAQHAGQSGFAIIRRGREAFTSRIMLADLAERSLDVQYYQWDPDATGLLLGRHLLRAADRGVRVRILVDDVNFADRDANLASFDAHPNIEVRLLEVVPESRTGG